MGELVAADGRTGLEPAPLRVFLAASLICISAFCKCQINKITLDKNGNDSAIFGAMTCRFCMEVNLDNTYNMLMMMMMIMIRPY